LLKYNKPKEEEKEKVKETMLRKNNPKKNNQLFKQKLKLTIRKESTIKELWKAGL
jgi:5'-3' exonuclease